MNADVLIDTLVAQGAKKPLLPPKTLTVIWGCMLLVCASILISIFGFRYDIADKLLQPIFILELTAVVSLSMIATWSTSWFSLPDNHHQQWVRLLPVIIIIVLSACLVISVAMASELTLSECLRLGRFYCIYRIIGGSILPNIILFIYLRKTTTVNYYWAGSMIGLATASAIYVAMRLIEPFDDPFVLLTWLFAPAIFVMFSGLLMGKLILSK